MKDESSSRLLNSLYQSAETGVNAVNTLYENSNDDKLKKELSAQLHKFRAMEAEIDREIQNRGETPKSISKLERLGQTVSLKMNLMSDRSPAHIAQMMIDNANRGVQDLSRAPDTADPRIQSLTEKLMQTEKNSANAMQTYLKKSLP